MRSLTAPEIARHLITFPTVNPPGQEAAAQAYLRSLLEAGGLDVLVVEAVPRRPNLVARLRGSGRRPPLILHGHIDVVGVDGQEWVHPPFGAEIDPAGILHGRGALDMKAGVAMLVHAMLRAARNDIQPSGDIVLAVVADSETGGESGLAHLLEHHSDLFGGARHAVGEFGGFPLHAFGRRFYRIGISQKQFVHLRLRISGRGGHGSRPSGRTVITRLGEVVARLHGGRLPYHRSPVVERVVESMADSLPAENAATLRRLLDGATFEQALEDLGPLRPTFESLFRDTANVTVVRAGNKFNVLPSEALLEVDARLLPGRTIDELTADLMALTGEEELDVEIVASGPPAQESFDPALMELLSSILSELDREAHPVPFLFNESPDGRLFACRGVQHYGFLPMDLPPELDLPALIHGPDERVPLHAIEFGAEAIFRLVDRY